MTKQGRQNDFQSLTLSLTHLQYLVFMHKPSDMEQDGLQGISMH